MFARRQDLKAFIKNIVKIDFKSFWYRGIFGWSKNGGDIGRGHGLMLNHHKFWNLNKLKYLRIVHKITRNIVVKLKLHVVCEI